MKKLLITNVVYGKLYANIFLNYHLPSLLDQTNIPQFKDRVEYLIFTDQETLPQLAAHPNVKRLQAMVPVEARAFTFPMDNPDRFSLRYKVLVSTLRQSVREALERGSYLSAIVADLVYAKGCLGKIFGKLDQGHDSVFMLPMRTAAESMMPILDEDEGALSGERLFQEGFRNLHPLWIACQWAEPYFSKLPYTLLWGNRRGLLARSFSITPIAFAPSEDMLQATQVIDVEIPSLCKSPYWCTDWLDCPIIGVEPLFCYYPPFQNSMATVEYVKNWMAKDNLHPKQVQYLATELYFPSREVVAPSKEMLLLSDLVVQGIFAPA